VEVALAGGDVKKEEKDEAAGGPTKVLPPWMIRQGMNLSATQRGEAKEEEQNEENYGSTSIDVKPVEEDKEAMQKKLQVKVHLFTITPYAVSVVHGCERRALNLV
jgi:transcription initiation factor TFIIE subunit alpha